MCDLTAASQFRKARVLGNWSTSGFKQTQCFILIGFPSALSHSVADFITGVRFQQVGWSHIRISLSRVAPVPQAFALLRLHLKDAPPPQTLVQRLGAITFQETCPATSKSLRLAGCSAPRSIQRPTQLCSPSSSSPSHSLGLGFVSASPRQLPLFTPRFSHLRCSSVWAL